MKLRRTGRYRDRGTSVLSSDDLTKKTVWNKPNWNSFGEVAFTVTGTDRRAQYRYEMTFTAQDLMTMLEASLTKMDTTSRAIGAGAIAALRELLVRKEQ